MKGDGPTSPTHSSSPLGKGVTDVLEEPSPNYHYPTIAPPWSTDPVVGSRSLAMAAPPATDETPSEASSVLRAGESPAPASALELVRRVVWLRVAGILLAMMKRIDRVFDAAITFSLRKAEPKDAPS